MKSLAKEELIEKCCNGETLRVSEEFWGGLRYRVIEGVKEVVERALEGETGEKVGCGRWKKSRNRKDYRNGVYRRNLLTGIGNIEGLRVPRIRKGSIRFKTIKRYQQRTEQVDNMVREMFLAGVSTRRVKEVMRPLLGEVKISASTVSNLTRRLDRMVEKYHQRTILDHYIYLILDGIYLKAKSLVSSVSRCVLTAYGITEDGKKELIDFQLAYKGESENAWSMFLNGLYYRGLEGKKLKLAAVDGNKGLSNAVRWIYPHSELQRCWAHKLRNVACRLTRKIKVDCLKEARKIYQAESYNKVLFLFKEWAKNWRQSAPSAVDCIQKDLEELLSFYEVPQKDRIKVRTTNMIERVFREVRRRTRPMSCFQNRKSLERIIFAIFYRMNRLWEKSPLPFTQNY